MVRDMSLPYGSHELTQAYALLRAGNDARARVVCRDILKREPNQPDALRLLARLSTQTGMYGEAVSLLRRACVAGATDADLHCQLGQALMSAGRDQEAIWVLTSARRGRAEHPPTTKLLATLLHRSGQIDDARRLLGDAVFGLGVAAGALDLLEHWRGLMPDDPVPQHRLAPLRGEEPPERAADGYVTYLFDHYADFFDASLAKLNYRAPAVIAQQLRQSAVLATGQWQVLDAGCGTGLCAVIARPFAAHLTGVDLSAAMVAKAVERGGYDTLVLAEITQHLNRCPERFDLILSADTLIYFGELSTVLTAASYALRPGGWLAFTLERSDDDDLTANGYRLNGSGRYSHTTACITRALTAADLRLRAMNRVVLREEDGKPVPGWVVLAQRCARGETV